MSTTSARLPKQTGLAGYLKKHWLRLLTHILAITPFLILVWDAYTNNLTFNPIQEATFRTGTYALVTLVLSLACTPLNILFGIRQVLPLRRPLGLYAFFYATLHFLILAVLDYNLDPALLQEAIFEKRYALVGFAAFLLLLPLAITSTRGWMRRLGKNWKRLHMLAYVAAPLAVVHYMWAVKADITQPLLYGLALAALFSVRIPSLKKRIVAFRQRHTRKQKPRPAPQGDKHTTSPQHEDA